MLAVKYYTCFGLQNRVTDVMLNVVNPLAVDIAACQIRPYDGGVNPLFSTHGSVDALCDMTWALRANQEVYHPLKVTPSALAIIRSAQLRTILDGVPYLGNRIYLVSLNAHPLIYADYELSEPDGTIIDDITGENLAPYHREFLPAMIETFDPANMTKMFIQYYDENAYDASAVKGWVDNPNVFVNFFGYSRKYNEGGEHISLISLSAGDLIRVKKDDTCLRPLDGSVPTEYTLTRAAASQGYWDTLPDLTPDWTTNVILAYVKDATEYPFLIEMVHDASGGVLLSLAGAYHKVILPGWWYPIVMLQYPLGKAGYLGAVPSYVQE